MLSQGFFTSFRMTDKQRQPFLICISVFFTHRTEFKYPVLRLLGYNKSSKDKLLKLAASWAPFFCLTSILLDSFLVYGAPALVIAQNQ